VGISITSRFNTWNDATQWARIAQASNLLDPVLSGTVTFKHAVRLILNATGGILVLENLQGQGKPPQNAIFTGFPQQKRHPTGVESFEVTNASHFAADHVSYNASGFEIAARAWGPPTGYLARRTNWKFSQGLRIRAGKVSRNP